MSENSIWYNNINATLFTSPNNKMFGEVSIYAVGEKDLDGSFGISYVEELDIDSFFTVRKSEENDLNARLDVKFANESDLGANVVVLRPHDIEATLEVSPHARMYGLFDIYEPPRIVEQISPVKDALVRDSREYRFVNFGDWNTMVSGRSETEEFVSYVQFNLAQYPNSTVFEDAKLRLKYIGTIGEEVEIELRTLGNEWEEMGVTYANRPNYSSVVSSDYTINKEEGYIEFDVLDYVRESIYSETGFVDRGLGIFRVDKGVGRSTFKTRENVDPSYLLLEYYDSRVQSYGARDLDATFFAYGASNQYLESTFEVHSNYATEDLEGTFYAHRYDTPYPDDFDATFRVHNPNLYGHLFTMSVGESDLSGTLLAYSIPPPHYVDGKFYVNTPDKDGQLYVRYNNDLEVTLEVRSIADNDIESTLYINHPDLSGSLYTLYRDSLSGSFVARNSNISDLDSIIRINRPDLHSTLYVNHREDIEGYMTVRSKSFTEINSIFYVSQPNLSAILELRSHSMLDGHLTVRQYKEDELLAKFYTSVPDLLGTIQPVIHSMIDGQLAVSVPDVEGTILPRVIWHDDFEAELRPRVIGVSDLDSTLGATNRFRGGYYFIL